MSSVVVASAILWIVRRPEILDNSTGSIARLGEWLDSFGLWAPVVSSGLFVLQALIAPLPNVPIIVANGILFGAIRGAVFSWVGAILGASASFLLARYARRVWLRNRPYTGPLTYLDALSRNKGFWIVVVARLMPIISMDFIGYAAGLGSMRFTTYLLACAIGQTPSVIAYSYLGHDMLHAEGVTVRLAAILALGLVTFLLARRWLRRQNLL